MAMMDEKKQRQCLRSVRCFRWNFLVSNVALGIIVLILAQLVLPSLAFAVLKRPSFDPGQRSEDEEEDEEEDEDSESENIRRLMMKDDDVTVQESHNDDDDDPKIQNIDLDLLRQHLIQSLGLPDVTHTEPQITVSREEKARAVDTYRRREREMERRRRRDLTPVNNNNNVTMKKDEEEVYTYFTHGVPVIADNYRAQNFNFRLGNLTRVLRVGERTMTSRIASATLYINRPKVIDDCPTLYLYHQRDSEQTLVKQLPNRTDWTSSVEVDVSNSVRRWIRLTRHRPTNFLLLLSCDKLDSFDGRTTTAESTIRLSPAKLEVRTVGVTSATARVKRYADDAGYLLPLKHEPSNCHNKEHNCCRKSVTISMKDLKVSEWVSGPSEFKFYYCKGKCKNATSQDNLHALIQNYMHQHGKKKKRLPKLCCTASQLSSMPVTYFKRNPYTNEDEITVGQWKNIIVEKCDCE